MNAPSPWSRAKAALVLHVARTHRLLYGAAARTWGGRPLRAYRHARDLCRPLLARARAWARRMSGAAAPPLHQPPPTLALLPRIGEVVEIEHLPEWIRAAAEALPDPMDADAAGKFAEALKQVAEPAASLLHAEWLARAGEGELALAALWSIDAPAPLEDLGLTALAPYVAERLTKLRTEGDQALASGQAARASERFRLALALNPSATDAYLRLAKALGAQGRAAEARLTLQRLLARAPDDAEANALMVAMTE